MFDDKCTCPMIGAWILEHVTYDPDAGSLYYRPTADFGKMRIVVLSSQSAIRTYGTCKIRGKRLLAARVAYLLKTGRWPVHEIRFENGAFSDIRWKNMCLYSEKGRSIEPDKEFVAHISDGLQINIAEANAAYLADLKRFHPHGPPTYKVTSKGPAVYYASPRPSTVASYLGSSAAACVDC